MKFFWRVIYEIDSKISGKIQVIDNGFERKLLIDGTTQSTTRPKKKSVWSGMVPNNQIESALILGLGAGTVPMLLRKRWPEVRIVAYELDPEVVRVATSFFKLDKQIVIRVTDARNTFNDPEQFDLIVVDSYSKLEYPDFAKKVAFMQSVKEKLTPIGLAAFNRIPSLSNGPELEGFEKDMQKVFSEVWRQKASYNLIFWGKK
jgi:spermidine synthase